MPLGGSLLCGCSTGGSTGCGAFFGPLLGQPFGTPLGCQPGCLALGGSLFRSGLLYLGLTGCQLVKGIFKAGVYGNDADNDFTFDVLGTPIVEGSADDNPIAVLRLPPGALARRSVSAEEEAVA